MTEASASASDERTTALARSYAYEDATRARETITEEK